jgi:peptidoglycan/xylan/chitin deacetylase (PgdA/CDA1 family)
MVRGLFHRPVGIARLPKWVRHFILWFLVALSVLSLWGRVIWPRRYVLPQIFGQAVFAVNTSSPLLALTFDDGPDPRYTLEILEILAEREVKATFFMVGHAIRQYPEVASQVIAQGHEIGNHTWNHHSLNFKPPQEIYHQLQVTDQILRDLGYQGPIPFRPPFGHNMLFLPWVLNYMERANIFWSIDPQDWDAREPTQILEALAPQIHNGGIMLLHDGDANPRGTGVKSRHVTVAALPIILDTYLAKGYQFVTLSELLGEGPPVLWRSPGSEATKQ